MSTSFNNKLGNGFAINLQKCFEFQFNTYFGANKLKPYIFLYKLRMVHN